MDNDDKSPFSDEELARLFAREAAGADADMLDAGRKLGAALAPMRNGIMESGFSAEAAEKIAVAMFLKGIGA